MFEPTSDAMMEEPPVDLVKDDELHPEAVLYRYDTNHIVNSLLEISIDSPSACSDNEDLSSPSKSPSSLSKLSKGAKGLPSGLKTDCTVTSNLELDTESTAEFHISGQTSTSTMENELSPEVDTSSSLPKRNGKEKGIKSTSSRAALK